MGKKAVLIGCNYAGTEAELLGCINDVHRMNRCLVDHYGFLSKDINVLIDDDDSYTQPTGRNIYQALINLITSAESGDFLFVHYSGHGFRYPVQTGDYDDTGYVECIVPSDFNLINDHDFRELIDLVPHDCRITIVSDSCHSGGLINESKEQIGVSCTNYDNITEEQEENGSGYGFRSNLLKIAKNALESCCIFLPSGLRQKRYEEVEEEQEEEQEEEETYVRNLHVKNKSLPLSTFINILKQKSGKDDINVRKIRPTLFDIFGEDSSPKLKRFMNVNLNNLQGGDDDGFLRIVRSQAQEFLLQKLHDDSDYAKPSTETEVGKNENEYAGSRKWELPKNGILISGCQTQETSADASPGSRPDQAYGALSNAIQIIIKEYGDVTNLMLVMKARQLLKNQGFTQSPGLYCNDNSTDATFVC